MYFTLIRHAETKVDPSVPITLWGLTDDGIAKVNALSESGAIKQLKLIYASQQTKAIETMLYLAKPNLIPMRMHAGLTEITSFTKKFYAGQEFKDNVTNYYNGTIERVAGGETIKEALTRFENALDDIAKAHPDASNIGIVTHGSIMVFLTAKYTDLSVSELHSTIAMPDVAILDWDNKTFSKSWGETA